MMPRLFVFAVGLLALALLSIREWDIDASPTMVIAYRPKSKSVIQLPSTESKKRRIASLPVTPVSPVTLGKLDEYWKIRKKVFLDLEQERRLKSLRRDAIFLSNLAPLFEVASTRDEHTRHVAMTLLIESAEKERSGAAVTVLRGIIADPNIENLEIPLERREVLAETKSEIMFRWTMAQPERSREISRLLPGPVSRKLWEKVQTAQYRKGSKLLVAIDD